MMIKHKRHVVRILGFIIILLSVLIALNIYQINMKYSSPPILYHEMSKNIVVSDNKNIEIEVKRFELLDKQETKKRAPKLYEELANYFPDFYSISILVHLSNLSNEEQETTLYESMLTMNQSYSNGLNLQGTLDANQIENLDELRKIEADSEKDLFLLFILTENSISKRNWKNIEKQHFYLTVNLYPEIERIVLK